VRLAAVLVLGGTLLFGCAIGTERFGRPLPTDRIAQIAVGRSTRSEVLELLGPPVRDPHQRQDVDSESAKREPVERALYWTYSERHERFASAILYTYFSQDTLTDTLMIVFDELDKVEVVALEQETKP